MTQSGTQKTRAHYLIRTEVIELFARIAPPRSMSATVEELIIQYCLARMDQADRERAELALAVQEGAGEG